MEKKNASIALHENVNDNILIANFEYNPPLWKDI